MSEVKTDFLGGNKKKLLGVKAKLTGGLGMEVLVQRGWRGGREEMGWTTSTNTFYQGPQRFCDSQGMHLMARQTTHT